MLNFFEKNGLWLFCTIMGFYAGTFLGHEVSEMNLERTYRALYEQRISDQGKLFKCVKQVARIEYE